MGDVGGVLQKLVRPGRTAEIELAVIERHAADRTAADAAEIARTGLRRCIFGRGHALGVGRRRGCEVERLHDRVAVLNAGRVEGVAVDHQAGHGVGLRRPHLIGEAHLSVGAYPHDIGVPATFFATAARHGRLRASADIDGSVAAEGQCRGFVGARAAAALRPLLDARRVVEGNEAVRRRAVGAIDAFVDRARRLDGICARADRRRRGPGNVHGPGDRSGDSDLAVAGNRHGVTGRRI